MLNKILKILFILSIVIFVVSIFYKNKLPEQNYIVHDLHQEPIQVETDKEPFEVERGGVRYTISPLFKYELFGLVVSYSHSDSWVDYYHKAWNDFINEKDVCVIWGDNLTNDIYKKIKYKNGSWTCYWQTKTGTTREEWSKFDSNKISNNHLLSSSDGISKALKKIATGDQIYIKGYLAEYAEIDGSFKRGTSISRTDKNNFSCETIFVTEARILKEPNLYWRIAYKVSLYIIIGIILVSIIIFFKPRKKFGK